MSKSVDKDIQINNIRLLYKTAEKKIRIQRMHHRKFWYFQYICCINRFLEETSGE
jgi:hypothetical protein